MTTQRQRHNSRHPAGERLARSTDRTASVPAFTLVELLIVITVIGLLVGLVAIVGTRVIRHQRIALTESTMRATSMAIDQFVETNPLANVYDRKGDKRTFGPNPPYQLERTGDLAELLEPVDPPRTSSLKDRLMEDLNLSSGRVVIQDQSENNDIRALYAYLAVFDKGTLEQIPQNAIKALPNSLDEGEYIDPADVDERIPVLGIYDAWGVPLDYFLYVKLELVPDASGKRVWKITQRTPVLRSRGVKSEVAEQNGDTATDWIFSSAMPTPYANAVNAATGAVGNNGPGWARAVPEDHADDLGFLPESAD